jgi:site-specific DNA-methyltransferase (adenine-specific)
MSTWFIQPETRNHNNHPAPYPEELVNRIVKLYSYRGNIVLDPFMGTGTTGFVCKMINRRYIGIDNSISDVNYARQRIASRSDIFDNYISRSDRMKLEKQEKTENVIENKVF